MLDQDRPLGVAVRHMAKLIKPVLFSQQFNARQADMDAAGLLDSVFNSDTKLFIDPLLLSNSSNILTAIHFIEQKFPVVTGQTE